MFLPSFKGFTKIIDYCKNRCILIYVAIRWLQLDFLSIYNLYPWNNNFLFPYIAFFYLLYIAQVNLGLEKQIYYYRK